LYQTIFADDFVFYFDDADVVDEIPASWGLQDELDAAEAMFEITGADNIQLTLTLPQDFSEPACDTGALEGVAYDIRVTIEDYTYLAIAEADFFLVKPTARKNRRRVAQ